MYTSFCKKQVIFLPLYLDALFLRGLVRFPRESGAIGPLVFVPQLLMSGCQRKMQTWWELPVGGKGIFCVKGMKCILR